MNIGDNKEARSDSWNTWVDIQSHTHGSVGEDHTKDTRIWECMSSFDVLSRNLDDIHILTNSMSCDTRACLGLRTIEDTS